MKPLRHATLSILTLFILSSAYASDWKGQWIWQEEDGPDNSWVAFRKSFQLSEKPTQAIASIAVDSKYWLWVNGKLVRFEGGRAGAPSMAKPWKREKDVWTRPASEKPRNTWYQEIDIAPYLRQGENLVAILVWHWGRETHKGTHIDSGNGGLYFQLDLPSKTIASDKTWKAKQHPAYAIDSGEIDRSVVQYDVAFDANRSLGDWTDKAWYKLGYDSNNWPTATEKGAPPTAPWYQLVFDNIPPLQDHGLRDYPSHASSSFPFVSDGSEIRARLPFNKQITPYIELESENGGETVFITTDNRLNRIDASYTTRPGKQSFECFSWMSGHEIVYQVPAGVKILGLKYRWLSVGEIEGSLTISDHDLQRLWDMGANTLMVCARDNFMDCPDRERALWIGDVADQVSYLFYVMGPDGRALLKRAIESTFLFSEDGSYGALGPLRIRELPSQSLQFVHQCVWEYYLNTGDREIIEFALPYIHTYLAKWEMGDDGLPKYQRGTSPDRWDWVDWGKKETHDKPVIQVALYYSALEAAQKMAELVEDSNKSEWCAKRMQSIKAAFDDAYWTGNYYSSDSGNLQDDRANALAILSGLATADKHQAVVENILIPNHFCSPHFEWMVNLAMCKAGYTEAAIERMTTRYRKQIDNKKLTTLWEMLPRGGSYNHAWNAPNTVIAREIAGIVPTQAGWRTFEITPDLLDIDELNQTIPSVAGEIEFGWKRTENFIHFQLTVPAESSSILNIPFTALENTPEALYVNGSLLWTPKASGASPGSNLTILKSDDQHVSISVPQGDWAFELR